MVTEDNHVDIPDGNEEEQDGDEPVVKVNNVIACTNLQQYNFSKKDFMAYVKDYFARIVKKLEENGKKDRIDTFKKGATAFIKFIMPKFDEIEIYCGSSENTDEDLKGGFAISFWEDESAPGPMFYFFKDGLYEEKY